MTPEELKNLIYECEVLFLGKKRFKLFGILSNGLKKRILSQDEAAYPNGFPEVNHILGTCTTDKELVFAPTKHMTRSKLIYAVLHQLLHFVCHHSKRMNTYDQTLWNLAADHVVNRLIYELSSYVDITMPDNPVFFTEIEDSHPNCSVETVYTLLQDNSNTNNPPPASQEEEEKQEQSDTEEPAGGKQEEDEDQESSNESQEDDPKDSGDKDNDDGGDNENEENKQEETPGKSEQSSPKKYDIEKHTTDQGITYIKITNNTTGKETVAMMDTEITKSQSEDSEEDKSKEDKNIDDFLDKMMQMTKSLWHSNQIEKGDMPAGFVEYLDDLFRVEVPWWKMFENAVLYPVQVRKRRSWMEPNFYTRRFAKLPGTCKKSSDLTKCLFGIDTSMSMKTEIIKVAFGVVADSINYYNGLWVLQHDVSVQKEIFYAGKPNAGQLMDDLSMIAGRGGTSHKPIFDRVTEILTEDDKISTFIFFTDYYSDIHRIYKNYPWIMNNHIIWLITGDLDVELEDCEYTVIRANEVQIK